MWSSTSWWGRFLGAPSVISQGPALEGASSVCVVTDLHFKTPSSAAGAEALDARLQLLRRRLSSCDLVVYSGDITHMDGCVAEDGAAAAAAAKQEWSSRRISSRVPAPCSDFELLAAHIVNTIGRPAMFTLGNHDGVRDGSPRHRLLGRLNASPHHVGQCDSTLDACVHRNRSLGIATLYSGQRRYYAHPDPDRAGWVDAAMAVRGSVTFALLVTHIPPPQAIDSLRVAGVQGETVCCWDPFEHGLPATRPEMHVFGHDHKNLFVSTESPDGVRYVAAFKSGEPPPRGSSYEFGNGCNGCNGYTLLHVSPGGARFVRSETFEGEDMERFYRNERRVAQRACGPDVWHVAPPPSPAPPRFEISE